MLSSLWRAGHRKWGDRRGAVALIYALAVPVTLGLVALAVDFGNATLANSQLKVAADSSALLATTAAANAYRTGSTSAAAMTLAQTAATNRFAAQAGNLKLAATPQVQVAMTAVGGQYQATVNYSGATATTFARFLGIPTIPFSGSSASSSSQLTTNNYVSISVLMDASMSMLIASDQNNINTLEALAAAMKLPKNSPGNAGGACAFACHWTTTAPTVTPPADYYALALQNHVSLRLTVLQQAATNLINSISALDTANNFLIGLYTFNTTLNTIFPASNNFKSALSSVSSIQPDVNVCSGNACAETYFTPAMQKLATVIGTSGSGVSAASPQKYLFIITDGVADDVVSGTRIVGTIGDTPGVTTKIGNAQCQAIKNNGVTIMVLYTTYTPIPENAFYVANVQPVNNGSNPLVMQQLESCSSGPNYFFQATDGPDILTQVNNMFQLVQKTQSHLTD